MTRIECMIELIGLSTVGSTPLIVKQILFRVYLVSRQNLWSDSVWSNPFHLERRSTPFAACIQCGIGLMVLPMVECTLMMLKRISIANLPLQ